MSIAAESPRDEGAERVEPVQWAVRRRSAPAPHRTKSHDIYDWRASAVYICAFVGAVAAPLVTLGSLHNISLPAGMHRAQPNFYPPDATPGAQPKHTTELPGDPSVTWWPIGKHEAYLIGVPDSDVQAMIGRRLHPSGCWVSGIKRYRGRLLSRRLGRIFDRGRKSRAS